MANFVGVISTVVSKDVSLFVISATSAQFSRLHVLWFSEVQNLVEVVIAHPSVADKLKNSVATLSCLGETYVFLLSESPGR